MSEKCKICNEEIKDNKHFWKIHKINQNQYYMKYFPRFDPYTKEKIVFKNTEQYFSTFFNSRANLINYLAETSQEEQKRICLEIFHDKIKNGKFVWIPTQVELKSSICPAIVYLNKVFGNYIEFCKCLGLKQKLNLLEEKIKIDENLCAICVDTREQTPFRLDVPFAVEKLNFGDYSLADPSLNDYVYVERKSLNDFISTLSGGYDRFKRELNRALEQKSYLFVLVEDSLSRSLSFNFGWHGKFTKATPDFIFHRVRELLQEFPNLQFVFPKDKKCSADLLKTLLFGGKICKTIDVQYSIDRGFIFC